MKRISGILLVGLLALTVTIIALRVVSDMGPKPQPASDEERVKAFTWFGNLGFPDVKDRPFVWASTGSWYQSNDDPPRNTYVRGFLLEQQGDTFSVLTTDLTT